MNETQLAALQKLLTEMGFQLNEVEQRVTSFNNDSARGGFTITYQTRFDYKIKLDANSSYQHNV
jgi:uncharacterized OsmC-like protein